MKLAAAFRTPDRDTFARWAAEAIPCRDENGWTYGREEFALIAGTDRWNLENLYAEYLSVGRTRRPGFFSFLRSMDGPASSKGDHPWSEAAELVVPVVRQRFEFEAARLMPDLVEVLHRPLTTHFGCAIALDSPATIQYVRPAVLENWDRDYTAVLARAVQRLRGMSKGPAFEQLGPGLYRSRWHDTYDGSRILLPELLASLDLSGNPVAALPNRNSLLVAGDQDERAMSALLDLTLKILKEELRPLNGRVLRLFDGRWEDFVPSGHLADGLGPRLAHAALLENYEEQTALLERRFEREGRNAFVASVRLAPFPDGKSQDCAVWVKDIDDGLLPNLPHLAFMGFDLPEGVIFVATEDVRAIVGTLLEATEDYPPRLHYKGNPTPEMLERLRAASVCSLPL